jgi:hypothetical protein
MRVLASSRPGGIVEETHQALVRPPDVTPAIVASTVNAESTIATFHDSYLKTVTE